MPDLDASDHRSYWAEGYTAVRVADTGFIRDPHYDTPSDTPETSTTSGWRGSSTG